MCKSLTAGGTIVFGRRSFAEYIPDSIVVQIAILEKFNMGSMGIY